MTKQDSQQIIEDQRQDWNRVAGAWEKWDRLFEEQAGYLNHRLVADARLRQGHAVCDVGSRDRLSGDSCGADRLNGLTSRPSAITPR
jgi:hypothetical protein